MKILTYEDSCDNLDKSKPICFLAGPTIRAHQTHLKSWRPEAIALFEQLGFQGSIIIPEFLVRDETNLEKGEIPIWEFNSILESDCVMFWVPRTEEAIGLTTNYELGYWTARAREKVVYGRPDDAYRISYPDIMWSVDATVEESTEIYNTLEDTVKAAIQIASQVHKMKQISEVDFS